HEAIFLSSNTRFSKHSGDLFHYVIEQLHVSKDHILHIGDNYHSDVLQAGKCGLHSAFLPRTIHMFENNVKGFDTGDCLKLSQRVNGPILDQDKLLESIGYSAMVAIAANHYFDNPFRPFNNDTDYNSDPIFIGYY